MQTVDIKNLSGRRQIIRLTHMEVCKRIGRCLCYPHGSCSTVHLAAIGVTTGVPSVVLDTAEMKRLLNGPRPLAKVMPSKPAKQPRDAVPAGTQPKAEEGKGGRSTRTGRKRATT